MSEIRIENFLYPYVRFVNACPCTAGADFYWGNSLVSPNLGFGCFSSYVQVKRGMQEFTVTEAGNKNKVLARISLPFGQGEVYTVALAHSDGGAMAYGIAEPVTRKDTDYGHIRICHLSPNIASLDVSANGHDILNGIDYLEVSRYICMSPGCYEFRAKQAADSVGKLIMPNQNIKAGKYNTLYIMGLSDKQPSLMGILTVDAASYTGYYL